MTQLEEKATEYLLNKHVSPLNVVFHQADLKAEMQYHTDIKTGYIQGYKDAINKSCELAKLYILNADVVDIFELEDNIRKAMEE